MFADDAGLRGGKLFGGGRRQSGGVNLQSRAFSQPRGAGAAL